jgi:hypothetical protein
MKVDLGDLLCGLALILLGVSILLPKPLTDSDPARED